MPPVRMFDRLRYIQSYFVDTPGNRVMGLFLFGVVNEGKLYQIQFVTGNFNISNSKSFFELIQTFTLKNESFLQLDIFCKVSLVTSPTDDGVEIQRTLYSQSAVFCE